MIPQRKRKHLGDESIHARSIHDCKAAIRWLRANAQKYDIDPHKIGVIGSSAGGHLVAMLGTCSDVANLEGELGEHEKESSRVTCVVDYFGPTDFMAFSVAVHDAKSPVARLLGGAGKEELAREASPIIYVSKDDPPFMLIHGTKDATVPLNQSERLQAAFEKTGVSSLFVSITEGGHGNFKNNEVEKRMHLFLERHLLGKEVTISSEPIPQGAR